MDISQIGNSSLQSAQCQNLLAIFDPSNTDQSSSADNSTFLSDLLQTATVTPTPNSSTASKSSNAATTDPLLQAMDNIDGTTDTDEMSSIFDSNFAMLQALQSSGMSSSIMNQVVNSIQTGPPYNPQGDSNSNDTTLAKTLSTTA